MCIFDKNLLYQHVPGQDSSPQLRGPDNTASGPTARLAMSLNFPVAADEVGQSTHFKTMTSLGMKRGEQSGSRQHRRRPLVDRTMNNLTRLCTFSPVATANWTKTAGGLSYLANLHMS